MNSLNIISMSYFEDFDILFQPMPYHDHANPLPYTDRSKNHITGDKLFKRKKKYQFTVRFYTQNNHVILQSLHTIYILQHDHITPTPFTDRRKIT